MNKGGPSRDKLQQHHTKAEQSRTGHKRLRTHGDQSCTATGLLPSVTSQLYEQSPKPLMVTEYEAPITTQQCLQTRLPVHIALGGHSVEHDVIRIHVSQSTFHLSGHCLPKPSWYLSRPKSATFTCVWEAARFILIAVPRVTCCSMVMMAVEHGAR